MELRRHNTNHPIIIQPYFKKNNSFIAQNATPKIQDLYRNLEVLLARPYINATIVKNPSIILNVINNQ